MSTTRFHATTMKRTQKVSRHSSAHGGSAVALSSPKKRRYADISDSVMEDRNNRRQRTLKNGSFRQRDLIKSGGDGDKVRRSNGGATEKRRFVTPVEEHDRKTKLNKSEDVKNRSHVEFTKGDDKKEDASRVLVKPERKLIQVEYLGGLKLRFKFSCPIQKEAKVSNHHGKTDDGGHDDDDGVKKLAVKEPTETTTAAAARVKKLEAQETLDSNCVLSSWRQLSTEKRREEARRKIESMTKTVDIPNNYYDVMGELDRMFGDSEWVMEAFYSARNEKPLEKLGLSLKH